MLVTSLQSLFFLLSVSSFFVSLYCEARAPVFPFTSCQNGSAYEASTRQSHWGGKSSPPPPKTKRGKKYKKTPERGEVIFQLGQWRALLFDRRGLGTFYSLFLFFLSVVASTQRPVPAQRWRASHSKEGAPAKRFAGALNVVGGGDA